MHHCVLCRDAFRRVALQHLVEEIEAELVKPWHQLLQELRLILGVVWLEERQVLHGRPCFEAGRASALEYLHQLVFVVVAGEQRTAGDELCEDAAYRPNVDRGVVVLASHQDVGRAVPQGHDLVSEVLDRDTEGACQTKVCKLQDAFAVDQEVLGLQISVEHFVLVALGDAVQELVQIGLRGVVNHGSYLDVLLGEAGRSAGVKQVLEVLVQVLENES